MNSPLAPGAILILDTLAAAGCEAYMVGGCVRDHVLNRSIQDIDIATSATPDIVAELFPKVIPTGLQHGTVTVLIEGAPYEVTTFRRESEYEDHRRPAGVEFVTSLEEDLLRRDFTINAMAMDRDGRLLDPFNGRDDLARRLIRCVGTAQERFREDALRMLRAVRFAGTLGFAIEPATWAAMTEERELLRHVAMERVRAELERLTAGPDPLGAWTLLLESGLLGRTKRPLALPAAGWSAVDAPSGLRALPLLAAPLARWTLLLRAMAVPPEAANKSLQALAFAGSVQREIVRPLQFGERLRERLGQAAGLEEAAVEYKKAVLLYDKETAERWLEVEKAYVSAAAVHEPILPSESVPLFCEALRFAPEWLRTMPIFSTKELAADGANLMEGLGIAAGPQIGRLLDRLLLDVVIQGVPNERETLLRLAGSYLLKGEA